MLGKWKEKENDDLQEDGWAPSGNKCTVAEASRTSLETNHHTEILSTWSLGVGNNTMAHNTS